MRPPKASSSHERQQNIARFWPLQRHVHAAFRAMRRVAQVAQGDGVLDAGKRPFLVNQHPPRFTPFSQAQSLSLLEALTTSM
jgi:hypothetical protein